ncbi:hypothetical protein [Agromyces italicus]|uniref:hypothetical protein n=1 Tax=Agromyces italicus TaxID=279572 RepID=UPI000427D311|nr:hypothetical protein [Agromyces italicus]
MRIGIDVTAARLRAVVVDADSVVWTGQVDRPRTIASGCRELLRRVEAGVRRELTGATLALTPSPADLRLGRIGLLRVSPAAVLGPLSGWPDERRAELGSRVATVEGGSDFLGTTSVHPDEQAVLDVTRALVADGVEHLVIAAAGCLADPGVERRVERLIRRNHPELAVTSTHVFGGMGLRERENSALLGAALRPWAATLSSELVAAFGAVPVSVARGVGGHVRLEYFATHPFGVVDGRRRAAAAGALVLAASDDLIVVFADHDEVCTIGVSGGRVGRRDVAEAWGVPHNHQPLEMSVRARSDPAGPLPVDDIDAAVQRRPRHEVVVVGDSDDERALLQGAFAVALGAARSEVVVETERIVTAAPQQMAGAVATIVEETRSRAIVAGADPRAPGRVAVDAVPISYVPDGSRFVRVSISGEGA